MSVMRKVLLASSTNAWLRERVLDTFARPEPAH